MSYESAVLMRSGTRQDVNTRLLASVRLAEAYGVPNDSIIRTRDDVDVYILGSDQLESATSDSKHDEKR